MLDDLVDQTVLERLLSGHEIVALGVGFDDVERLTGVGGEYLVELLLCMQDVLGVMHSIPELAKERMKTLLAIQYSKGDAKSLYYPGTGRSTGGGRSDDHLWSAFSVCTYIKETGDYGFLDERVAYVDGGEGTVCEHLMRGLDFTRQHVGSHGIPLFLEAENTRIVMRNAQISTIHASTSTMILIVFFIFSSLRCLDYGEIHTKLNGPTYDVVKTIGVIALKPYDYRVLILISGLEAFLLLPHDKSRRQELLIAVALHSLPV